MDRSNTIKEWIADEQYRIRLDDLSIERLRIVKSLLSDEQFPVQTQTVTVEEFVNRLEKYALITSDLQTIVALIAHWGNSTHLKTLRKIIVRMSDSYCSQSGKVAWINLRWYATLLLLYSGGISAISAENYDTLHTLMTTKASSTSTNADPQEIIVEANKAMWDLSIEDLFKQLPGHERHYVPRSEYLFKLLQPLCDDLLYLGTSYEEMFDRFESFQALFYADLQHSKGRRIWGPLGRFAYKHCSYEQQSGPLVKL